MRTRPLGRVAGFALGPTGSSRFRLYTSGMPEARNGGSLTIAQISDIHCGGVDFVPNLLERAIREINDLGPDIVICSGDLTTFGFKHEYAQAKRTSTGSSASRSSSSREPRLAQRRLRPLRGPVRRPELGAADRRGDRGRGRLDRARSRPRPDRPRALPLDRRAVRRQRRPAHLRPAPPPAARPRHGARAQRRLRRGRRDRVPPARRGRPRALGSQARALRLAPGETCSSSTPARSLRSGSVGRRAPVTT